MKNYLVPAGVISLIHCALYLLFSFDADITCLSISIFLVIAGTLFLSYSSLDVEKLYEKRNTILTFGIISLPFSIISSIIILCAYDRIKKVHAKSLKMAGLQNNSNKQKTAVSKETKKLDGLLKIGIAMITIAGIMIATTSWDVMSNAIKTILIILIGLIFLGLYKFSEVKLKIRGTTVTYWILAMVAFLVAFLTVGNFGLLGEWLSLEGDGSDIFVCLFGLSISGVSLLTYKKFDIHGFINLAYISLALSICAIINFISQELEISLLVVSIIVTIINLIPSFDKKEINIIKKTSVITSFVLFVILMYTQINFEMTEVLLITAIIQILNFANLAVSNKNEYINVLSPINIIILLATLMGNLDIIGVTKMLWFSLIIYILSIVMYFVSKKVMLKKLYLILASIGSILALISNSYELNLVFSFIILIGSFVPFIISKFVNKEQYNSTNVITFLVALFVTFITFVGEDILSAGNTLEGIIVLAIYLSLLIITSKDKLLSIFNIIGIASAVYFLLNTIEVNDNAYTIFSSLILIVSILAICVFVIKNDKHSNVILAILLPSILLRIMFEVNIVLGIYVAIIAILMIISGYLNKNYYAIYVEGIVVTVLNLLIQISEYWGTIPLWAYLLIGGITLIAIVTVKELKKSNISNSEVVNNIESENVKVITEENNENKG